MKTKLMSTIGAVTMLFVVGALYRPLRAQSDEEKPRALNAEEKAIADQADAYVVAYNKGDAKALAGFFADDAEWVDEDGGVLSGRTQIEAALKSALAGSKGRKLDLAVESVRALTPEVLVEKGTSTLVEADGTNAVSSYTAVHIKKGNDWLISQLTETGAPLAGSGAVHLRELEWLVGSWSEKSPGVEVKTKVDWTPNHAFLTRTFSAQSEGENPISGTEVIGWDSKMGRVRSWLFESDGTFSENLWRRDGPRWLIEAKATLPDGRQSTAQHTLTREDNDKHTWASANRQVDGELLPNIGPIEIVRGK